MSSSVVPSTSPALDFLDLEQPFVGEVEGDPDRHRALGDAPFVAEVEAGLQARDPAGRELLQEALDHLLERPAFDPQVEVADASGEDLGCDLLVGTRLDEPRGERAPGVRRLVGAERPLGARRSAVSGRLVRHCRLGSIGTVKLMG